MSADAAAGPRPPARRAGPPIAVLIESDPTLRAALHAALAGWGMRVLEPDLASGLPVRDEMTEAAAIIAEFELSHGRARPNPISGLDLALQVARRAGRRIPTMVMCADFGRKAIPACSPHRFPVLFRPVALDLLHGWLVAAEALDGAPLAVRPG